MFHLNAKQQQVASHSSSGRSDLGSNHTWARGGGHNNNYNHWILSTVDWLLMSYCLVGCLFVVSFFHYLLLSKRSLQNVNVAVAAIRALFSLVMRFFSARGPDKRTALQFAVFAGELSDEILFLSWTLLASGETSKATFYAMLTSALIDRLINWSA